jgi:anaerobic C4-dicarboxylate transporter
MFETITLTIARFIHATHLSGNGITLACGLGVLVLVFLFR